MSEVKGLPELLAGMDRVSAGLDELTEAPRVSAQLIADDARSHAPKLTGRLARSIIGRSDRGRLEVGSPLDYGLPVHFGVPARNQGAQPFLFRALATQSDAVLTAWAKDVQSLIDKETRG